MIRALLFCSLAASSTLAQEKTAVVATASQQHPGRVAAELYCQSCHLFPEPELLDRETWKHALRAMAPYVGVAKLNYANIPGGQALEAAEVFPKNPILSREEWIAINDYYAAASIPAPEAEPAREPLKPLPNFRAKVLITAPNPPMVSLLKINETAGTLSYSDGAELMLATVDAKGALLSKLPLHSAASSLAQSPQGQFISLIGNLFPSDAPLGQLARVSDAGKLTVVLPDLPRTTDVQAADLNNDGITDLVLCVFGHRLGRFSWLEGAKDGNFREHVLLDRPGAIRARIRDADGDGRPDIFVVMGQAREGIFLFRNKGKGVFQPHEIALHHPAFGSADMQLADFNKDGHSDVLLVNGDNGEFPSGLKGYHGLRIYLRRSPFKYEETLFLPLNGAFGAVARDFDKDGDIDIAAVSFFPDYAAAPQEAFVYFQNQGDLKFTKHSFPEVNHGRWILVEAGDLDGDGDEDIFLGSFVPGPKPVEPPAIIHQLWAHEKVGVMILENLLPK